MRVKKCHCNLPMSISWIHCKSTRFTKACTDKCMLPVVSTAVSHRAKHFDAIITGVSPVEITMNPVIRNVANETSADWQCYRCAIIGTPVFPANTSHWLKRKISLLQEHKQSNTNFQFAFKSFYWLRGTAVERWSLTSELSLSCARPAADGWPFMWVNCPL